MAKKQEIYPPGGLDNPDCKIEVIDERNKAEKGWDTVRQFVKGVFTKSHRSKY